MLARLDLRGVTDLGSALPRPSVAGEPAVVDAVRAILADVRQRGDVAVRELTKRFDGVDIDDLAVPDAECKRALESIAPALRGGARDGGGQRARLCAAEASADLRYERDGLVVRTCADPSTEPAATCPAGGRSTRRPC